MIRRHSVPVVVLLFGSQTWEGHDPTSTFIYWKRNSSCQFFYYTQQWLLLCVFWDSLPMTAAMCAPVDYCLHLLPAYQTMCVETDPSVYYSILLPSTLLLFSVLILWRIVVTNQFGVLLPLFPVAVEQVCLVQALLPCVNPLWEKYYQTIIDGAFSIDQLIALLSILPSDPSGYSVVCMPFLTLIVMRACFWLNLADDYCWWMTVFDDWYADGPDYCDSCGLTDDDIYWPIIRLVVMTY